jgi:hypothetical protein
MMATTTSLEPAGVEGGVVDFQDGKQSLKVLKILKKVK